MTTASRSIASAYAMVGFATGFTMAVIGPRPVPNLWTFWLIAVPYCIRAWIDWRKEQAS